MIFILSFFPCLYLFASGTVAHERRLKAAKERVIIQREAKEREAKEKIVNQIDKYLQKKHKISLDKKKVLSGELFIIEETKTPTSTKKVNK